MSQGRSTHFKKEVKISATRNVDLVSCRPQFMLCLSVDHITFLLLFLFSSAKFHLGNVIFPAAGSDSPPYLLLASERIGPGLEQELKEFSFLHQIRSTELLTQIIKILIAT